MFRKATELGGHLVVAFVAPVSAGGGSAPSLSVTQPSPTELEAASAQALLALMIQGLKPID